MAKLSTEQREELPTTEYACPIDNKLPISDAAHIDFDQVITDQFHPAEPRKRILAAVKRYGVDMKDFDKGETQQSYVR